MNAPRKQRELHPEEFPEALLLDLFSNYQSTGYRSMEFEKLTLHLCVKLMQVENLGVTVTGGTRQLVDFKYESAALAGAVDIMEQRGWVTLQRDAGWPPTVSLLPQGIDHASRLLRPWYVKMWDSFKGDVRAIVVAAITAIAVAVVTTLILRALGWG